MKNQIKIFQRNVLLINELRGGSQEADVWVLLLPIMLCELHIMCDIPPAISRGISLIRKAYEDFSEQKDFDGLLMDFS